MFDTKVDTKDAARVFAVGKCLSESRGKLLHFPSEEKDKPGKAVWAGLVTELTGATDYHKKEYTFVTCLGGQQFTTGLALQEAMALVADGVK